LFTPRISRRHDLNDLGQRIEAAAPEVAGALPRKGSAEDERLFELLRSAYVDARYKMSFRISREDLKALEERVLALAERIRSACVEHMGRLGGEVAALRAGLPRVPEREERILAELPVPTEPAELEAWKRELVARAEAEGRRAGTVEGALKGKQQALLAVLAGRGLAIPEAFARDHRLRRRGGAEMAGAGGDGGKRRRCCRISLFCACSPTTARAR
jgi:hypothetical protein